jgi:hypothetical protein
MECGAVAITDLDELVVAFGEELAVMQPVRDA